MKGYIIVFNTKEKKDITTINHKLFGRINNTISGSYYYSGILENTKYIRLCNGCYFAENIDNNLDGLITIIVSELFIDTDKMVTAKDYWQDYINKNKLTVKNL